jgi:hypothetical protein
MRKENGPLSIKMPFDEAMTRLMRVHPKAVEKKPKAKKKK